jgi:hypothetical protein
MRPDARNGRICDELAVVGAGGSEPGWVTGRPSWRRQAGPARNSRCRGVKESVAAVSLARTFAVAGAPGRRAGRGKLRRARFTPKCLNPAFRHSGIPDVQPLSVLLLANIASNNTPRPGMARRAGNTFGFGCPLSSWHGPRAGGLGGQPARSGRLRRARGFNHVPAVFWDAYIATETRDKAEIHPGACPRCPDMRLRGGPLLEYPSSRSRQNRS